MYCTSSKEGEREGKHAERWAGAYLNSRKESSYKGPNDGTTQQSLIDWII